MLIELKPEDFSQVLPWFGGRKQHIPVVAIAQSQYPGRVFVDNAERPRFAVVWATGRWAYIAGDFDFPGFARWLEDFVRQVVIPDSQQLGINWFELYGGDTPLARAQLASGLKVFSSQTHLEVVHTWRPTEYQRYRASYHLPPGWIATLVDLPILPPEVTARSLIPPQFRTRTAAGAELRVGDKLVAVCRSNGFAAGSEFMIDIVTPNEQDRGKGYATAAGTALLDDCLSRGLSPLWETTEANTASLQLAKKFGFVAVEKYPVHAIEF